MIEIALLFLSVYGVLAAPGVPDLEHDYRVLDNRADIQSPPLPGTQNLQEKAIPISKLYAIPPGSLPGIGNLAERSQIRVELPGTRNLAEKRIPEQVLLKLSQQSSSSEQQRL